MVKRTELGAESTDEEVRGVEGGVGKLLVRELKPLLVARGVDIPAKAKKAKLVSLLQAYLDSTPQQPVSEPQQPVSEPQQPTSEPQQPTSEPQQPTSEPMDVQPQQQQPEQDKDTIPAPTKMDTTTTTTTTTSPPPPPSQTERERETETEPSVGQKRKRTLPPPSSLSPNAGEPTQRQKPLSSPCLLVDGVDNAEITLFERFLNTFGPDKVWISDVGHDLTHSAVISFAQLKHMKAAYEGLVPHGKVPPFTIKHSVTRKSKADPAKLAAAKGKEIAKAAAKAKARGSHTSLIGPSDVFLVTSTSPPLTWLPLNDSQVALKVALNLSSTYPRR